LHPLNDVEILAPVSHGDGIGDGADSIVFIEAPLRHAVDGAVCNCSCAVGLAGTYGCGVSVVDDAVSRNKITLVRSLDTHHAIGGALEVMDEELCEQDVPGIFHLNTGSAMFTAEALHLQPRYPGIVIPDTYSDLGGIFPVKDRTGPGGAVMAGSLGHGKPHEVIRIGL